MQSVFNMRIYRHLFVCVFLILFTHSVMSQELNCTDLEQPPDEVCISTYDLMAEFKNCEDEVLLENFCTAPDKLEKGKVLLSLLSKFVERINNHQQPICSFLANDSVCFFNSFDQRDAFSVTQNLTRIYSLPDQLSFGRCFCCCKNNPPGECENADDADDGIKDVDVHVPDGKFCGGLTRELFGTNMTLLNITEDSGYTGTFFNAIQVLTRDGAQYIDVDHACEISICGVRNLTWHCFVYNETTPENNFTTESNFDLASISCGCGPVNQQVQLDIKASESEPECKPAAAPSCELYQEVECQSRKHRVVIVGDSQDYATEYAAVIRSIALHEDCTLRATAPNGQSKNYTSSHPKIDMYYQADSTVSPYVHFGCSCSRSSDVSLATIVIIVSVGFTLLLAVGVIIAIKIRRRKKKLRLTVVEVEELGMELFGPKFTSNNNGNVGDGDGNGDDDEVASASMLLQFDAKFTVKKADIQCNKTDSVGRGNFGLVYKGRFCPSKMEPIDVAVKTIDEHVAQVADLKALINEIRIMAHIGAHENIVLFIGAHCNFHSTKWEILSIMELCEESLYDHLRGVPVLNQQLKKQRGSSLAVQVPVSKNMLGNSNSHYLTFDMVSDSGSTPSHSISEERAVPTNDLLNKWSADIANAMEFLATKNVLHIDLATRNILLAKDLTAKICDFGLSRKLYEKTYYQKQKTNDTLWLPLKWTAIETFNDFKFSAKSDIWAYGVTVWEIFSLAEEPYQGIDSFIELVAFLNSGRRLPRPRLADEQTYELLTKCWEFNEAHRPSFSELKSFFSRGPPPAEAFDLKNSTL